MGTTTESKLRRIIREELDYYFDRLEKTLTESKSTTTVRETVSKPSKVSSSTDEERQKFRKKFGGLMGKITENMDISDLEEKSNSILDNNILESLESNSKTQAVHRALTKDYSALLKKMNK